MRALTFDIDWAPDWMVEDIALNLLEKRARATFFVTHDSPALALLRAHPDLFELGIHPNLLPGSTQGGTEDEVMSRLKRIVPEAVSMRTHGLYQTSAFLLSASEKHGMKTDVSLFLPGIPRIQPHRFKYGKTDLFRIPYNWEDDFEMFADSPRWEASVLGMGDFIFNFHPVHVALNSITLDNYEALKRDSIRPEGWTRDAVEKNRHSGKGAGTFLDELADSMSGGGARIKDFKEENVR